MKRITDKMRLDWLEKQSRDMVVSFHHPDGKGFAHVRKAIDEKIALAQKKAKSAKTINPRKPPCSL